MMKNWMASVLFGVLISAGFVRAHSVAGEMVTSARRFMSGLNDEQKQAVARPFDGELRSLWHFVPDRDVRPNGKREGLSLRDMRHDQRLLALSLVHAALSHRGAVEVHSVMALERVLYDTQGQSPMRDAENYFVTIYGEPSPIAPWGWRFEGHHLSINVTVAGGRVLSVTPSFFGANPGEVRAGSMTGWRVLADEEDKARELIRSLNEAQRAKAIITETAPRDIITGNKVQVERASFLPPRGLSMAEMTEPQASQLMAVIEVYVAKYRPEIIKEIRERDAFAPAEVFFAWAGGTEPGQGHYYRVQTTRFLFEYDNTQGGANHIHSVWRDFDGDFGRDMLAEHYHNHPHPEKEPVSKDSP